MTIAAHSEARTHTLEETCHRLGLFVEDDGILSVPAIVRGRLVIPERIDRPTILRAFDEAAAGRGVGDGPCSHVTIGATQVLRHPISGGPARFTRIPLFDPVALIETDPVELARDLYDLPFDEVMAFCRRVGEALEADRAFLESVRDTTRATSDLPAFWHDAGFETLTQVLDVEALRRVVDCELMRFGVPGTTLLDAWTEVDTGPVSAPAERLVAHHFPDEMADRHARPQLRALGTRQLHVTAGNAPQVPLVSALRALATKAAAVIKSPRGATAPAALLATAAAVVAPEHPITRHLSVVYWKGGDARIEDVLFQPGAFDRIVVWGDPDSVLEVKRKAALTKVVAFNPRYSVSLIGREAFDGPVRRVAVRGAADALVANQKACIASQVHYVEGTPDQVRLYAQTLRQVLAACDAAAPNNAGAGVVGAIKRLRRGRFLDAEWLLNETDGVFSSGVVISPEAFPMMCHPMCRLVVVRPVADLADAIAYLHPAVATVGIYPAERRRALRTAVAAAGVSNAVALGTAGSVAPGQGHDGMMVLSELVDWKNG